jgi:hypothetical protein
MNEKIKEFRRTTQERQREAEVCLLQYGEIVQESGIYEAIHKTPDVDEQGLTIVAVRGEKVKPCAACGEKISLRLLRSAPHISEDADFACPHE